MLLKVFPPYFWLVLEIKVQFELNYMDVFKSDLFPKLSIHESSFCLLLKNRQQLSVLMVRITLNSSFQCPWIPSYLFTCLASYNLSDLGIVFTMLFQSSDKLVLFVGGPKDMRLLKGDIGKYLCSVFHFFKSRFNTFERPCAYSCSNLLPVSPVLPYSVN